MRPGNATPILRRLRTLMLGAVILPWSLANANLPTAAPVPGGVAIVEIGPVAGGAKPPKAWFDDRPVLVVERNDRWQALVGLPLSTKPGTQTLLAGADRKQAQTIRFTVESKNYPEQRITLKDKAKVDLSPEDLARTQREQIEINRMKNHWRDTDRVDLDFLPPAEGPLSGRFGVRRFFNNQPRSPHTGLDFAVDQGTPVVAPAAARVLGTGDYFFSGNTVFLDHGNGLITLYAHLDRIDVTEGQSLERGQRVGLVGKTGRATGPHLHWGVILNGTSVDPELFIPPTAGR